MAIDGSVTKPTLTSLGAFGLMPSDDSGSTTGDSTDCRALGGDRAASVEPATELRGVGWPCSWKTRSSCCVGVGADPKGESVSGARVVRAVVGGSDSAAPNNGGGAGAGDGDGAPAASAGDGAPPASASGATPCRGGAGSAGTPRPPPSRTASRTAA